MKNVLLLLLFIFTVSSCKNSGKEISSSEAKVTEIKNIQKPKQDTIVKKKYPKFLTIDFLMGKFDPSKHKRFVRIEDKYTNKQNVYLDKSAYTSFLKMYEAAYNDGFKLLIVS